MIPELDPDLKPTFWGKARFVTVSGPFSLMRLAGRERSGRINDPYGRFWFNEKVFWDALDFATDAAKDPALQTLVLKTMLRQGVAVADDWNTFSRIYQMRVPSGVKITAWVGRARAQEDPNNLNPMIRFLFGGEFQYIIDVKRNGWEKYVVGPISPRFNNAGKT